MFELVRLIDGQRPVMALLEKCFGANSIPDREIDELLQSLQALIRFGILHFKESLQGQL
jgi:hypothetical protein